MLRRRYRRILWFFGRVLLHLIWWDIFLPFVGFGRWSGRSRARRLQRIAARFRKMAIELGGVMIKVGQWLSSRLDILPPEITSELAGLQDEVAAEPFEAVRGVIESEFQRPLESLFASFEPQPVAAASIGQVHRAQLYPAEDGSTPSPVVVKVQRPNIEAIVETDLKALQVVGRWVDLYPPVRRRANVPALLDEFSRTLLEEIDYLHEAKNAETFRANFLDDPEIIVPQIHWTYTTRRVLTLEEVGGIKITDKEAMLAAGIEPAEVAKRLFDAYLKQILDDHFFHADPHPGNLFVHPVPNPADEQAIRWQLVFVDFGMAGEVTPPILAGIREMIIAVGQRDAERLIKAYQMMGVLLPGADLELLRQANQRAFERFWGKSTSELVALSTSEAMAFGAEFLELIYDAPFQLPDNLILLGRCLSILSGICTGLDENFNVWVSIIPYAQRLIAEEGGAGWRAWVMEAGDTLRTLVTLPRRADSLLSRLEQGRLEFRSPELKQQIGRLEKAMRRLTAALFFAVFLFSGVQLYLAGQILLAIVFATAALLSLIVPLFLP
ncbi:MAG: AarF/ABC1/UbiB kinase family protein [Bellilinea sp.]|nr:AarF/ABC1/UbiB kinase family protein [Bellilinea sp.]